MITEVKMQVTSDLSKRVQEIVFANGEKWSLSERIIKNVNKPYLYITKNKYLAYGTDKKLFEEDNYEEISAYDFIASRGEQKWLPKFKEEALFSYDGVKWYKDIFTYYKPKEIGGYSFNGMKASYNFCKPLQKQMSFIQFLKDNNAYEKYMNNVKIENQRWDAINDYIKLEDLKTKSESNWLFIAFSWKHQREGYTFWKELNNKWTKLCENVNHIVWE